MALCGSAPGGKIRARMSRGPADGLQGHLDDLCAHLPRVASAGGIDVAYRTRHAAVVMSGMLVAMGGAYGSIGFTRALTRDMTGGRGFSTRAARVFSTWRPLRGIAAAVRLGVSSLLAQVIPSASSGSSDAHRRSLSDVLPYVRTLIAVATLAGRSTPPRAADGRQHVRQ